MALWARVFSSTPPPLAPRGEVNKKKRGRKMGAGDVTRGDIKAPKERDQDATLPPSPAVPVRISSSVAARETEQKERTCRERQSTSVLLPLSTLA